MTSSTPTPEQQSLVLINAATLREAEALPPKCPHCRREILEKTLMELK